MFANQFVSLTNGFTDRQRIAAELLIIGVAFQRTNTTWQVISIEGDDLGVISTFVVSETACMLKKCGLKSNAAKKFYMGMDKPYITFAHDDKLSSIPDEVVREMLDRRFRNPVTLM
jgi:hypothetical protein